MPLCPLLSQLSEEIHNVLLILILSQSDSVMRHLEPPVFPKRYDVRPRGTNFSYQPDGKPICIRCNKADHIARFYKVDLKSSQLVTGGDGPRSSSQSNVTSRATVDHSEN